MIFSFYKKQKCKFNRKLVLSISCQYKSAHDITLFFYLCSKKTCNMKRLLILISFVFAAVNTMVAKEIVELWGVRQVCPDDKHDGRYPNKASQKLRLTILKDGCYLYFDDGNGEMQEFHILLYSETGELLYDETACLSIGEGILLSSSTMGETHKIVVFCSNVRYEGYLDL